MAENMSYETCYEILGLRFGAPYEEIRQAYRFLSRRHHPDRFHGDHLAQRRALRRQKELNQARDLLKAWFDTNPGVRPPRARFRKGACAPSGCQERSAPGGPGPAVYAEPGDLDPWKERQEKTSGFDKTGRSRNVGSGDRAYRSECPKDSFGASPAAVGRSPHERFEGGFSILTLVLVLAILMAPMCSIAIVLRTVVPVLSHGQLPDLLGQAVAFAGLAVSFRSLTWYFRAV